MSVLSGDDFAKIEQVMIATSNAITIATGGVSSSNMNERAASHSAIQGLKVIMAEQLLAILHKAPVPGAQPIVMDEAKPAKGKKDKPQ